MMKLGSEGVYLHEKCGTNPSRYLPGPKNTINIFRKCRFGGLGGARAQILFINSGSASGGPYFIPSPSDEGQSLGDWWRLRGDHAGSGSTAGKALSSLGRASLKNMSK